MCQELPFEPMPFLTDPHHQTIVNAFFTFPNEPISVCRKVQLADGDQLAFEVTTPKNWKETDLTVLLVHGLCGSHQSSNLVRMAKKLESLGVRAVRFNMRGCGSGRGLAKHIYHSGRSDDLFEVLKVLKKEHPESPVILIGFSLGGNITLKLVGELNSLGPQFLHAAIAVSPPVDLYSSIQMLGEPCNEMYEKYFYKLLREEVHWRHKKFSDLPPVRLPKKLKLYEFDQLYVAPSSGFSDVMDYYNRCSSMHVVEDIGVPCKILFSYDDPIVSHARLDHFNLPSHIQIYKTKLGGHMGYVGDPRHEKGTYWLDSILLDWIKELTN